MNKKTIFIVEEYFKTDDLISRKKQIEEMILRIIRKSELERVV